MIVYLAHLLTRFRWLAFTVAVVCTVLAAVWAAGMQFDFAPQAMFASSDEEAAFLEEFNAEFGPEDHVVIIALEATGDTDVLHEDALTWLTVVHDQLEELPGTSAVQSVTTIVTRRPVLRPPWIVVRRAIEDLPVEAETAAVVRREVGANPLIDGTLVSKDRKVAAVIAFLDGDLSDIEQMRQALRPLQEVCDNNPPPDGYALHITGLPPVRVDIVENLKKDQAFLTPLTGGVFFLVLLLLFRRVLGAVLPLLAVLTGLLWTVGFFTAAGMSFNIISNVLPVLLLIIGVSNCVHILSRYAEEGEAGEKKGKGAHRAARRRAAMRHTIAHTATACLLATATTGVGFLSLTMASSRVLQVFGWQAAVGMGFLFISAMVIMTALLPFCRPPSPGERHDKPGDAGRMSPVTWFVTGAGYAAARHPWISIAACGLLTTVALVASRNVIINTNLIETYEESHPTLHALRTVEKSLTGIITVQVSLQAENREVFFQPDVFRSIASFERYARSLPEVTTAESHVDVHEGVYRMLRPGEEHPELPPLGEAGERRIAKARQILAQASAEEPVSPQVFIAPGGRRARILLRLRETGSRDTLILVEKLNAQLAKDFPPGGPVRARLTGDGYLGSVALDRVIRTIFYSLLGASVVIFLVIGVLFRSIRTGLLASAPNLTPLIVTLGYMGIRGYDLNVSNVIVFAISLGMAVDDTIHFLARFREEIKKDVPVEEAIRRTFLTTGRAIVLTTILIVVGLSVLTLSEFLPTRRFAELVSVTMTAALVGDLLLLPACLALFWRGKKKRVQRT